MPLRIAIISPVWFRVPPDGYGGIEWVVSLLADSLVDAVHGRADEAEFDDRAGVLDEARVRRAAARRELGPSPGDVLDGLRHEIGEGPARR